MPVRKPRTPSVQNQIFPAGVLARRLAMQREAEQQQEADMHGAHHLARQIAVGGGAELEGGEGDGDQERDPAGKALAAARRQAFDGFFDGGREPLGPCHHPGSGCCFAHPSRPEGTPYFNIPASL